MRALRQIAPHTKHGPAPMLGKWMTVLVDNPQLEVVRMAGTTITRREGRPVVRIDVHLMLGRLVENWLRVLERIDGTGWLLELVSIQNHVQYRSQHEAIAARVVERVPTFEHALLVGAV